MDSRFANAESVLVLDIFREKLALFVTEIKVS